MKRFVLIFILIAALVSCGACAFILNNCPDSQAAEYLRQRRNEAQSWVSSQWNAMYEWFRSFSDKKPEVETREKEPSGVDVAEPETPVADPTAETDNGVDEIPTQAALAPYPWKFSKENWYGGRGLVTKDVAGKVIMVYVWNSEVEESVALLPRIQRTWAAYRHKPIMVIGSHRGGAKSDATAKIIKEKNLTFPNFEGAGFKCEPRGISQYPFIYVVNAKGQVVYRGRDDMAATEALVSAIDFKSAK